MRDRLLLPLALGSAHAALLLGALVLLAHRRGALGSVLETTGTARGVLLFLALWGIATLAGAWALRRVPLDPRPAAGTLVVMGFWAGAAAGPAFLLALLLASVRAFEPALLFFLFFAGAFAVVVGGVLGALLALVDALALRAADAIRKV